MAKFTKNDLAKLLWDIAVILKAPDEIGSRYVDELLNLVVKLCDAYLSHERISSNLSRNPAQALELIYQIAHDPEVRWRMDDILELGIEKGIIRRRDPRLLKKVILAMPEKALEILGDEYKKFDIRFLAENLYPAYKLVHDYLFGLDVAKLYADVEEAKAATRSGMIKEEQIAGWIRDSVRDFLDRLSEMSYILADIAGVGPEYVSDIIFHVRYWDLDKVKERIELMLGRKVEMAELVPRPTLTEIVRKKEEKPKPPEKPRPPKPGLVAAEWIPIDVWRVLYIPVPDELKGKVWEDPRTGHYYIIEDGKLRWLDIPPEGVKIMLKYGLENEVYVNRTRKAELHGRTFTSIYYRDPATGKVYRIPIPLTLLR